MRIVFLGDDNCGNSTYNFNTIYVYKQITVEEKGNSKDLYLTSQEIIEDDLWSPLPFIIMFALVTST